MIDYKSLPSTKAQHLNDISLIDSEFEITYTVSVDEQKLYKDISKRLIDLEKSLGMDKKELEAIKTMAEGFQIAIQEKEEILLRIDWLHRLYTVKEEIGSVDTKEKAMSLRKIIASVQTCPIKNELMAELDQLTQSLPSEETQSVQMTDEEALMEKAIEEAGDSFINLGKAGRDTIITDVLKQSSKKATIEAVQEQTKALEQRVEALKAIKKPNELINQLESLPIPSFNALSAERKGRIAETLLENNKWNGLASLDRMIAYLDKAITKEELEQYEKENTIILSTGNKAAVTIDAESL